MTFDEWWNNWSVKDWNDIESAKNLFQQAFEAGLHADVHTDNSKVIAELEEKLANADYQLEGRDVTIKELEAQLKAISLKIIYCIKSHLCKQDEDYDKPIISPKFLSDTLDQMAIDGFEKEIKGNDR